MPRLAERAAAWLRALWRRRSIRPTIAEEIAFHVDMETDARRGRGLSPRDARRSTLADFGSPALVRAEIIDVRTPRLARIADGILQDIRYALRTFARTPLAIGSVVVVLAVAIGVTSTVFAAIDAVFFKPLDVPHPARIVYVSGPGRSIDFDAFVERARSAIELAAITRPIVEALSNDALHLRARGEEVGVNYFATLQLQPILGRFFAPVDTTPGTGPVSMVISYDLWKSRLGFDSSIVGKEVQMEGRRGTIVGVAPAGFHGVALPWLPTQFWVIPWRSSVNRTMSPSLIARMPPGVSDRALMAAVKSQSQPGRPATDVTSFIVRPAVGLMAPEAQVTSFGFVRALADTVAAMALIVMLIAASNVVGILLARGVARSTEMAVRQALGAGARRLAQQLATESLMLGLAAGAAGVIIAWMLIRIYRGTAPAEIALDIDVNARVLGLTLVICSVAGLLVGVAPVRQARRVDLLATLGAPGATVPLRTTRRLRYGAVGPQMALSVALLIVAGAHARALWAVEQRDPGYRLTDVVSTVVRPPMSYYSRQDEDKAPLINKEYFRSLLEHVRSMPGVVGAAFCVASPATLASFGKQPMTTRSRDERDVRIASAGRGMVSDEYFSVLGIPLISGRLFDNGRDQPESLPVVIVSAQFAREVAADGEALGRLIDMSPLGSPGVTDRNEIVGIVGDIREGAEIVPMIYQTTDQLTPKLSGFPLTTIVRIAGDAEAAAPQLASTISAIDSRAQVDELVTLSEVVARAHFARRLTLALVGVAAIFGVVLAAIGLYSAVSYSVAQQTKTLAVRATLGASGGQLLRLVVGDGARTVLIALVPGICLGLVAFRITGGLITFITGPVAAPDASVVATVSLVVAGLSVVACLIPGWRAARVSPMVLLK
jgi:predicted permease